MIETAAANDDDVQLHWSTVGVELPEADREALLCKVVKKKRHKVGESRSRGLDFIPA